MQEPILNFNHALAVIDQIVNDIFNDAWDIPRIIQQLNTWYDYFINHMEDRLRYSETIEMFIEVVECLVEEYCLEDIVWNETLTHDLVTDIQELYPRYLLDKSRHAYQESKNSKPLETYIRELCNHHKRLLFVRVDLKYNKEDERSIDIRQFNDDIRKLRERLSNKKSVFANLQGYAWALEQGYEFGGLHCHLLLIYDGNKHQNGWALANRVGDVWKDITQGQGSYFNCNATKRLREFEAQEQRGIGMIYGDDDKLVGNAINTALYLTKTNKYDQRLKVTLPRMRTFGHGTYRNTKRRGLPSITK